MALLDSGAGEGGDVLSADAYRAVATLHHAYLTGLILTTVTRRDARTAADLVFRTFRRQHLEKFLPGLDKLGLRGLPDAVAAAQYHYLYSLTWGPRRAPNPPDARQRRGKPRRSSIPGAAICAVPSEVSRAMLRGWHDSFAWGPRRAPKPPALGAPRQSRGAPRSRAPRLHGADCRRAAAVLTG